jgi:uncharacterized protein with ParB-like and HNH nuclease domain
MEANKKKITDIFTGSRLLKVPFFQRSYVWKKEQWERLLLDMEYISKVYGCNEHGYFLGSIIFKQMLCPVSNVSDIRTIIDGQQRLTTIAIFLKVLYLLNNQDSKFRRKFFLEDDESVAIDHSNSDKADFEKILKLESVQNVSGGGGIVAAYNYFKENIIVEKYDIDAILKNVLFVLIDLGADEDEQLIFDTINSLGVRLTTGELLKNYFFRDGESAIERYKKYWWDAFENGQECVDYWSRKMTTGRIKKDFSETFFYCYLQIKIQDRLLNIDSDKKKIFRRIEGLFANYKQLINDYKIDENTLVKEITNYGKIFRDAFPSNIVEKELPAEPCINRIAFIIFVLDVATLFPYIMYVKKNVRDEQEQNKIFEYLESYIIRRFICDCKTNNYSDFFSENLIGQEIKTYESLKEYVERKSTDASLAMPSDEKVMNCLLTTKYSQNKRPLGILYLLESRLRADKKESLKLRFYSEYSLEHLMPVKWKKWPLCEGFDEEQREDYIKTLGNLAMITGTLNATISNSVWKDKLAGKAGHEGLKTYGIGLYTLKNALNKDSWDENTIKERAEELGKEIVKIWKM